MKIYWKPTLIILALFLVMNSCRKKEVINNYTPYVPVKPSNTSTIKQFFDSNMVASQYFTLDASITEVIYGIQGTRIEFKQGAFKWATGVPVTTGSLDVELKEIYTKGDMILSGIMPMAYGQPLVSAGEFYLSVKQNGEELLIQDTGLVNFELPFNVSDTTTMYVFNSNKGTLQGKNDTAKWNSPLRTVKIKSDSSIKKYVFTVDRMNWINCDYFYSNPNPKTMITVVLTDTIFNSSNTIVFMSLKGILAAARLYENSYRDFVVTNIPTDLDVTFVAIAERNGQYYMSFTDDKITANHHKSLVMVACTLAELKAKLKLL